MALLSELCHDYEIRISGIRNRQGEPLGCDVLHTSRIIPRSLRFSEECLTPDGVMDFGGPAGGAKIQLLWQIGAGQGRFGRLLQDHLHLVLGHCLLR